MTDTNNADGAALLPVTQADRDAAAALLACDLGEPLSPADHFHLESIQSGRADDDDGVQAFASHRITHSLPGDVGRLVRAAEAVVQQYGSRNPATDALFGPKAQADPKIGELMSALSSPLPATQEDAERSGESLASLLTPLWEAVTAGDLSTAERHTESELVECPMCHEGSIEAADYCNIDSKALGVQFYGIGPEHGAHERLWTAVIANFPAILAALAHPAQATPSAVSGDAGEARVSEALGFGTGNCASLNLQGALDDLQGRYQVADGGVIARTIKRVIGQIEAARAALPSHKGAGE